MSKYPIFELNATTKNRITSESKVINSDEFEYYLWVKLPDHFCKDFYMYSLDEMAEPEVSLPISECCSHENRSSWYRVASDYLNKHVGLHVYRMHMVNRTTNDSISLFFSYVVQCDHPSKPYMYMERNGKCGCS